MINFILLVLLLLVSMVLHKFSSSDSFPKLHPIVSSVDTFNYKLPRFLCDLLPPLVPDYYQCKDTFSFVSQIKNANFSRKCLVSYHVASLFSNIPFQQTINIAINLILNHNPNLSITNSFIFLNIYTPPEDALTRITLFLLK